MNHDKSPFVHHRADLEMAWHFSSLNQKVPFEKPLVSACALYLSNTPYMENEIPAIRDLEILYSRTLSRKRKEELMNILNIQFPDFFTGWTYHLPTMADDIQEEMEEIRIESEARGEARGISIGEARGEARGIGIGEVRGESRERTKLIRAMLQNDLPLPQISEITSLPVEEILKIQNSMKDPE